METYVDQIRREHAQMLVEEVDLTIVDTLGNLLADLVRAPAINHVQFSPAVLCFRAGRSADKQGVF